MPKKKILICTRVSEPVPVNIVGELKVACTECGELVWVSPSSWTITHDNPGIEIVCAHCAESLAASARSVTTHDLTPAQVDEIVEILTGDQEGD